MARPELFIALIGAAGTDLDRVRLALASTMRGIGYRAEHVRVSSLIAEFCNITEVTVPGVKHEETRVKTLMDAGDLIRSHAKRGDAVTWLALARIRALRADGMPQDAVAYIIDSLKHPDEVETLRRVYDSSLVVISAYSPQSIRKANLMRRIANSYNSLKDEDFADQAEVLIDIDERRPGTDLGQNVRDTFPLADFFVKIEEGLEAKIGRFVNLLFGHPYITPTPDEYWMFHAKAAALRSADLSRQVGAVITSTESEFIAAGCNEVPVAGGGAYWEGMPLAKDDRDFRHGRDANAVIRYDIVKEFVAALRSASLLAPDSARLEDEKLTEELLFGAHKSVLSDARVRNLVEFGRIVHAEMSALTDAARRGLAVNGGTLYCTTFPCHMCARHVIAAGIRRVVYTEPYPKSLTKELYAASISADEEACPDGRVAFEPFTGVAPRLYFQLFSAPRRKDARGYTLKWDACCAAPKLIGPHPRYLEIETAHSNFITTSIPIDAIRRDVKIRDVETMEGEDEGNADAPGPGQEG